MIATLRDLEKAAGRVSSNPSAPANLYEIPLDDLTRIGYKQLDATTEIQEGDLMHLADKRMWALVENPSYLRKVLNMPEVGRNFVLRHER